MGYQSLNFNGNNILAYVDAPTSHKLEENDVIFVMPLNKFFKVINEKKDTRVLRDNGFERIHNTQLRNYGVLKFKKDNNEIFIERKTHLLLKVLKEENGNLVEV